MMKKWSLNLKMYFVMGILITAAVTISYMGLSKMNEIKTSLDTIVFGPAARVSYAFEIKSLFLVQIINEKNLILEDEISGVQVHLKRLAERDVQLKEHVVKAMKISTEKGKQDLTTFLGIYAQWWDNNLQIQKLITANKNQEAFQLSKGAGRALRLKVEELLEGVITRNEGFMLADTKEAEADYDSARTMVLIISISSIVIGLSLGFFILRQLAESINQVVQTLTDGSSEVTSAAQMIASSSEELSEAATEQASSLEETASAIDEMNSMVQKNAESSKRTSELARNSNNSAEKGKNVVRDMIQAIDEISDSNDKIKTQIDDSNEKISDIVKVIAEIGNKTKVINDIVFQTKLLSFNASVEAARAGEHGKGFAVVAEEVGNLAEMSGNAAKEISDMLDGSIQKVQGIVNETKTKVSSLILDGKNKVEAGTRIAQDCGQVLNEIVDNISSVSQMANEISTACSEQAIGVQEITKAMSQLDQVTQTNASASEQVASSAEQLSGQSESLHAAVGILVRVINGADEGHYETEGRKKTPPNTKTSGGQKSNVVSLKTRMKEPKKVSMKHAIGPDVKAVPSEHDPRFEEA
jgi:methyl-accepting chemotaxis protein